MRTSLHFWITNLFFVSHCSTNHLIIIGKILFGIWWYSRQLLLIKYHTIILLRNSSSIAILLESWQIYLLISPSKDNSTKTLIIFLHPSLSMQSLINELITFQLVSPTSLLENTLINQLIIFQQPSPISYSHLMVSLSNPSSNFL